MRIKLSGFKRAPRRCICLCGMKQKFKSNGRYFKMVKDISLKFPLKLKGEILRAKCLNPSCEAKTFITIFPKGIERHSGATPRLKQDNMWINK